MLSTPQNPPTRAALRRLLAAVLKAGSELDAFCIDHFFQVWQLHFAQGMSRLVKTNLLLEFADPAEIFIQLERNFTQEVTTHSGLLQEEKRTALAARRLQELRVERERLEQARQTLLRHSVPPQLLAEVDEKLLALRREQRQGPQLNEGELIANRYSVMQKLGQGGFATVWLAYDRESEPHIVALKVLHGQFAKDQTHTERFLRGARKMVDLVHPHIVPVLDGPHLDPDLELPYFVMPYLSGGDLRDAVLRQGISREEAIRAVMEIGQALEHAHSHGLVHRDVKPQNILLDHVGEAYLTDFDLVLGLDNTLVSRTGQGAGTVTYAAPEQLQSSKRVDRRADVYSLAMTTLFVLCAEDLPPTAMAQAPKYIADLKTNDSVKQALTRALTWQLDSRTPTVAMLCQELREALVQPDPIFSNTTEPSVADSPLSLPDLGPVPPPTPFRQISMPKEEPDNVIGRRTEPLGSLPSGSSASRSGLVSAAAISRRAILISGLLPGGVVVGLLAYFFAINPWLINRHGTAPPTQSTADFSASRPHDFSTQPDLAVGDMASYDSRFVADLSSYLLKKDFSLTSMNASGTNGSKGDPSSGIIAKKDETKSLDSAKLEDDRKSLPFLNVTVQPGAIVYIDGELIHQTPVRNYRISLGKHNILLKNDSMGKMEVIPINAQLGKPIAPINRKWNEPNLLAPVVQKKPGDSEALVQNAKNKLETGEPDAAVALFSRAAELDPRNAEAVGGLGEAFFEQGNFEAAARNLGKAVRLAPRRIGYRELLVQALYKVSRFKDCVDESRKLLMLDPSSAKAKQSLELAEKKLGL